MRRPNAPTMIGFVLVGLVVAWLIVNLQKTPADFVTNLIRFAEQNGYTRIEPRPEAESAWTNHVMQIADKLLITKTDSWFTGINRNIEGRDKRMVLLYAGGAPRYRSKCEEVVAGGYADFQFS